MDQKTRLVVKGYLALSKDQQKEVAEIVKRHEKDGTLTEEVRKGQIGMGPIGSGCPCCGR